MELPMTNMELRPRTCDMCMYRTQERIHGQSQQLIQGNSTDREAVEPVF